MKKLMSILLLFLCGLSLFGQAENIDKSQSPYFHIQTEGATADHFPLLSTKADVNITGPIADVKITQVYKNDGTNPLEALYVFPASTRAAVYEMTMYVGDRVIKAEIQEKNKARQTYEKAKSEGKRTSLLEQHRPNVFQMNVANIMPGEEIRVEMKYNEFIIPENKIYSFIYPTVVGPRFGDPKHQNQASEFIKNPFTKQGTDPAYDFDINVQLHAGMPIKESFSPSHKIDIYYASADQAVIGLKPGEEKTGERDFIFNYSLSGNKIQEGTFLYEHGDENFFLTMIQPPNRITAEEIPNREYIFVMDVSGSMRGFPLDISKKLMKNLVANLKPTDKFNVLLFAGGSQLMAQMSLIANQANLAKAYNFIDNQRGGGGTQLLPALKTAMSLPSDEEVNSRSVVVVTDGYVHVEREAFNLIANNLNKANLFAFGIGSSVNRHLIEGMANAGRGEAFIITDQKYANKEAEKFRKYIETPVLTNIDVSFDGISAYDMVPFSFPDLLAERPLYVFGKYKGAPKGKIIIKGHQGNKVFNKEVSLSKSLVSKNNAPIRYLWAREKIRWLDDLSTLSSSADDVKDLTDLGLKYNLLTKYTSFVAVDKQIARDVASVDGDRNSILKTVKQVLPLPHGVSNHAVGFELKVEGVKSLGETYEEIIFVHVKGEAERKFKNILKETLESDIIFSTGERKMLNGNTLFISYDAELGQWKVKYAKSKLTKEFLKQFIELLDGMYSGAGGVTLKINLLWV